MNILVLVTINIVIAVLTWFICDISFKSHDDKK